MNYEDAEQLWNEIEYEGLGYWVQNYGYEGEDKELERLCKEAKKAMDALYSYTQTIFDEHDLG